MKTGSVFVCQQCGFRSSQYLGKCPECDSWNTLVEQVLELQNAKGKVQSLSGRAAEVVHTAHLEKEHLDRLSTGLKEFDRVLGGGIVKGSLVLVSGDPGIGKSTLLTQLALAVNRPGPATTSLRLSGNTFQSEPSGLTADQPSCLYVAGEESARQIKLRVERIKPGADLLVINEIDIDIVLEKVKELKPGLVIIDSIQTVITSDLSSSAGSVGQVKECAARLQHLAKSLHIPIFIVGHVTKEGTVAGPKTLEHVVDVVLSLEGDPQSVFRILRTTKNRFGSTDEVGIFEMVEQGLIEVENPSRVFLENKTDAPGSAVAVTLNGLRPIVVEVQALVTKSFLPVPRRVGTGVDNNRLQLLVAVLLKRAGLNLFDKDIYVNIVGGIKVTEPAVDLAICAAIASSLLDKPISSKTAFVGEVGLLGEIRPVRQVNKRSQEAKQLGFSKFLSPESHKTLTGVLKSAYGDNKD